MGTIATHRRNRTLGVALACAAVLLIVTVMTLGLLLGHAEARHALGIL